MKPMPSSATPSQKWCGSFAWGCAGTCARIAIVAGKKTTQERKASAIANQMDGENMRPLRVTSAFGEDVGDRAAAVRGEFVLHERDELRPLIRGDRLAALRGGARDAASV